MRAVLSRLFVTGALACAALVSATWLGVPKPAAAMLLGATSAAARPPSPAKPATAHIARGKDSLELLSQSTWVGPGRSTFQLHLAITASDPAAEGLVVDIYDRLITRSQFQEVLAGVFPSPYLYYQNPAQPLDQLPAGPGGGADVDMAVNSPGGVPLDTTGVYPVQVFLEKQGLTQGKPLTTFLVYAGTGASSFKHLAVSLVVPLTSRVPVSALGALGRVPSGVLGVLEADMADLGARRVPVTVQVSPSTLEAMQRAGGTARASVAKLAGAIAGGDELLPGTGLPLNVGSLVSSGLQSQLGQQLTSGDAALRALLGTAPSLDTWVLPGPVDQAELRALYRMGASQVAVPEGSLSSLPAQYMKLTFAQPAYLRVGTDRFMAVSADSELSGRIGAASVPGQASLVAYQVLGELAMIDQEQPSVTRGVVLLPRSGTTLNPTFLSVLLSGLEGNPLLRAVTLQQQFGSVPPAPVTWHVVGPAAAAPLAGAGGWHQAQSAVASDAAVFGTSAAPISGLEDRLDVATSSVWSGRQRASLIAGVQSAAASELHKLRLPPSHSITLTSRRVRLPLQVLSGARMEAHVRLVLSSAQLSFQGGTFGPVRCEVVGPGSERCQLDLAPSATTTFRVPVVVRTPGAFQLSLEVETPDGAPVASGTDTINSTAVSGVGLALMVGAALFLGAWWVRNARHGRRSRRLVPSPADKVPASEDLAEEEGEASPFSRGLQA